MKKILALVLCLGMIFGLTGCFGAKKGEIGKTYTSTNDIEFTLNQVETAEVIDGWGGANDDFWKPIDENNCNIGDGKRFPTVESYQLAHGLKPKNEDERIVFISYTAKNVSTSDKIIDEVGVLNYDKGYEYSEAALAYRVSEEGVWKEIPSGVSIKKLNANAYEFRAYMIVPKEVVESDKSLTYTLFGYKFEIR